MTTLKRCGPNCMGCPPGTTCVLPLDFAALRDGTDQTDSLVTSLARLSVAGAVAGTRNQPLRSVELCYDENCSLCYQDAAASSASASRSSTTSTEASIVRRQPPPAVVLTDPCDLRHPEEWFPEARKMKRKVIYHGGASNSGKTYEALKIFYKARTGIYSCPLRLLATEVYEKTKEQGIACDLITGEDVQLVNSPHRSAHCACTVQMANTNRPIDVAIIDEIQCMAIDTTNGWAFTRALFSLRAKEIHLCGDVCTIELVSKLMKRTQDEFLIQHHDRSSPLSMELEPVIDFRNINEGDCVVCFSKRDVRDVVRKLEHSGKKTAKIYGLLPAECKRRQAKLYNDPRMKHKVLVATDAVGLGLNLTIRRIVFYSLAKALPNLKGRTELKTISPTLAKHIAGRAGRQFTRYQDGGYVTSFKARDYDILGDLMDAPPENIAAAGIRPPMEFMQNFINEHYSQHEDSEQDVVDLMKTYMRRIKIDRNNFFLCDMMNIIRVAERLSSLNMELNDLCVFACIPLPILNEFALEILDGMAEQFVESNPVTVKWLKDKLKWDKLPMPPESIPHLEALEEAHVVCLHMYKWLSNSYDSSFPDGAHVDEMIVTLATNIDIALDNMHNFPEPSRGASAAPSDTSFRRPRSAARRGRY